MSSTQLRSFSTRRSSLAAELMVAMLKRSTHGTDSEVCSSMAQSIYLLKATLLLKDLLMTAFIGEPCRREEGLMTQITESMSKKSSFIQEK